MSPRLPIVHVVALLAAIITAVVGIFVVGTRNAATSTATIADVQPEPSPQRSPTTAPEHDEALDTSVSADASLSPLALPTLPTATAPAAQSGAADAVDAPKDDVELRGVWIHVLDETILTRAGIAQTLDTAKAGGVNTVIVEVARRHEAFYDSAVLQRSAHPLFEPGLDVLDEVIIQARARGMNVHAWFTAMPAWMPESVERPSPENWTYIEHGPDAPPEATWMTFTSTGEVLDYLDPAHPEVSELITQIAAELAMYDVDAVHVDYLRYPDADSGYNPVAIARFQAETGRTDVPAPDDPNFCDWRREQTTRLMHQIHDTVTAVNPQVRVSAALIAWGDGPTPSRPFETTEAYSRVYQPWDRWVRDGVIDVAMPMLYFAEDNHADFHRNWTAYVAQLRAETNVRFAPGQASWLNTPEQTRTQMAVLHPGSDGVVLFSYQEPAKEQGPEAFIQNVFGNWTGDPP